MTEPRVSQLPTVAVQQTEDVPARVSQMAVVTLLEFSPPIQVSQMAVTLLMGDNGRILRLREAMGLPCFSPCATLIHRLGE